MIIGRYLMQTDVKYLCSPIRFNKNPMSLTYSLGKPLFTTIKDLQDDIFVIK